MPGCSLLPFDMAAGRCRACGEGLSGGEDQWCGPECRDVYERNHHWHLARAAAIERDAGRCVDCGWSEGDIYTHQLRNGQLAIWSRHSLVQHAGRDNWLEVNHVEPRAGAGYALGCWHHLANLETLCHKCHVKVTRRQRVDRARRAERARLSA
jgi:5-methylcytosine-specific restriction endonuclease McrA